MKNNLAVAYLALSQVEERVENCRNALTACREGLACISREELPLAYAALQNSLGNAYLALAEEAEAREDGEDEADVMDAADGANGETAEADPGREPGRARFLAGKTGKDGSRGQERSRAERIEDGREGDEFADEFSQLCFLALQAYSLAAGIYSRDEHPWLYATAQNNLSTVYLAIGRREDPAASCIKAMKAAEQALSFFTLDNSPQDYAEAQMNLWMAYLILADIEYREENCSAALDAARERLKATLEFGQPMQLACCYKDLAITACMLADVETASPSKIEDCREAIDAALEALRIYRVQSNPAEYAETQTLLWAAYSALAEADGRTENSKRAIYACQAAIRVYRNISPSETAYAQKNLAHSFIVLAERENRTENCQRAIEAWQSALDYYTAERAPLEHADILRGLAYAYLLLSQVGLEGQEVEGWRKKALRCYKKALRIYQEREKEMAEMGDPGANEAREMAERCQRSLQSCRAMMRAKRKGEAGRQQERPEAKM
jgi:tetratricopeptide (TPR) repeat protein